MTAKKKAAGGKGTATKPARSGREVREVAKGELAEREETVEGVAGREETGEDLLQRILRERRKNWTGKGQYKEPDGADRTGLTSMPLGWPVASVDQLCSHITSGSRDWSKFYDRGAGTFVLAQNIRPMRLDLTVHQSVDAPEGDAETERTRIQKDDILVTIVGAKTGDVCRVPRDLKDHFVCQSVALLRPVLPDYSKYLEAYLASQENGQVQWKRYIYGQGRPHLSFEQLRSTAVPLAPLAVQERIIAEIEKQFTRLDVGVAALKRVQANLKRYRAAVLKAACEGRLVPTEAELARTEKRKTKFETGEELLARILKERRKNWQGRGAYKEPEAPPQTGKLPKLPAGWIWATVEEVSSWIPGAIQSGPFGSQLLHSEFRETGVLAIGIDNVRDGVFSTGRGHRIGEEKYEQLEKFAARPGDVVVTVMATIGRVCVLPSDLERSIITKHCYRITPARALVDSRFLSMALRADAPTRWHLFGNMRGQTRPGLNGSILKLAPVPIPPRAEQDRIVAEVERRLSVTDELESVVVANLLRATRLRQSILQKAFSVELI